jgi:hypothetical protein
MLSVSVSYSSRPIFYCTISVKVPPGKGHEQFDESVGKDEIVRWKGPEKSAQDGEQVHQVIP